MRIKIEDIQISHHIFFLWSTLLILYSTELKPEKEDISDWFLELNGDNSNLCCYIKDKKISMSIPRNQWNYKISVYPSLSIN